MSGPVRRAFTLLELLVVVAIVGILIAMLIPGASSAWQVANATQCRNNLNKIFQAEALWLADRNQTMFATGGGWAGSLMTYLEGRGEVLCCPSAVPPADSLVGTTGQVTIDEQGSSGGGGGGGGDGGTLPPVDDGPDPPKDPGIEIGFDVYSNANFTDFLWNVGIDSKWARTTKLGSGEWRYQIEDRGYLVDRTGDWSYADDYADIDVAITYERGSPVSLRIIQQKGATGHIQGYRFDLKVNGDVVVHNMDQHYNAVVDLRPAQDSGSGGTGGGGGGSSGTIITFTYVPTNYGMSLGVYRAGSRVVDHIDSKLFLILDFPKRIVNFTGYASEGKDDDSPFQDKYFITDPETWVRDYGQQGEDWRTYQSLRHFGRANVLFCDGHVESLGLRVDADDAERGQDAFLDYFSSRWVFRGR